MKKHLWEVEIYYPNAARVLRHVRSERLTLGSEAENTVKLLPISDKPWRMELSFDEATGLPRVEKENVDKVPGFSWEIQKQGQRLEMQIQGTKVTVREKPERRRSKSFEPESWAADAEAHEPHTYALWHFHDEVLIESRIFNATVTSARMKCGYELVWTEADSDKILLKEHNGDVRTLPLVPGRKGALRAQFGDHFFVLTRVPERSLMSKLDYPELLAKKREWLAPLVSMVLLIGLGGVLAKFLPEGAPEVPAVEAELSPQELTKITIEKKTGADKASSGGNGQLGGGGIETEFFDPKGGSGFIGEAVAVPSRATAFGSIGGTVLGAISKLDSSFRGKSADRDGAGAAGKALGSANGVLGALNSLGNATGKGGGGLGIGGVGTKGLGGGGGGGKGLGFGTGLGDGLGRGKGLRDVIFEGGDSVVKGGLERSEVDAVVQQNISQIRFCYNRGLRGNPGLQGKVVSHFVIGAGGTVTQSRLKESTLAAAEVEDCIKTRVASWKFPQPRGGGDVTVSYPFLLKAN